MDLTNAYDVAPLFPKLWGATTLPKPPLPTGLIFDARHNSVEKLKFASA